MLPELATLIELQKIDISISELQNSNITLNTRLKEVEEKIEKEKMLFQEIREKGENLKKELRSKERKLQQVEQNLERLEKKIYEVKSQKELQAVDHEIAKSRQEKSEIEDIILELMTDVEDILQEINEKEKTLNKDIEEFNILREEIQLEIKTNTEKLDKLKEKRENIVKGIEQQTLLTTYERIRRHHENNIAVVRVKGETCQGCFLAIPPQQVNEIKIGNELIQCSSCGRILYWENEVAGK